MSHLDSSDRITDQDQITKLLHLHAGLERQLQLATLDDNVREIEQMYLERIQHALSSDNDLLRLLFHRKRANQRSHFFCRLPFGQLSKTFLTCPDTGVNDLRSY